MAFHPFATYVFALSCTRIIFHVVITYETIKNMLVMLDLVIPSETISDRLLIFNVDILLKPQEEISYSCIQFLGSF